MKKENVSQIISNIDDRYTDEASLFELKDARQPAEDAKSTQKRPVRIRWGLVAACLATLIVIGSGVTAFAAEAREYKTAVTFFEENGLSTEGLSRSDIKAVYRDISTKSFALGKTAEVLRQSVYGWEIEQDEPTPEQLAGIWEGNFRNNTVSPDGTSYRIDIREVYDEKLGYSGFEKCVFECYRDAELLWSAEFRDFYVTGYAKTDEGTMVWGNTPFRTSLNKNWGFVEGWFALVDGTGNVKWRQRLNHGFKTESISSVINNGDGTLAVIGRGDTRYLCLTCCDAEGKELSFHKTDVGNLGIRNAARLGDGYIVQLWNQTSGDTALLCKMDRDGIVTDNFEYEDEKSDYYITDMIEFEGQVYLSAYAVPKQKDDGGRHEIANVLEHLFAEGYDGSQISDEELTRLLRDNYTAMLLLCDPVSGTPKTFYSVKGSLGGGLSVNDSGLLEWKVESIASSYFSPMTNSYTIGGSCRVFRYSFDASGKLTSQTDTGESVRYAR